MTDYAALVQALYDVLGGWQLVADRCNGSTLTHSAGYYQQIATGRIKEPSEAARLGIESAPGAPEVLLKRDFSKNTHGGLTVRRDLWLAMNLWRNSHSMTWDEWHEKADALMRREYAAAPTPCDEKPV